MMTTQFPERVREQEAQHVRHNDIQKLDALLRIEELLVRIADMQQTLVDALPPKALMTAPADLIKEGFSKEPGGVTMVSKKKNSRQL